MRNQPRGSFSDRTLKNQQIMSGGALLPNSPDTICWTLFRYAWGLAAETSSESTLMVPAAGVSASGDAPQGSLLL